MQRKNVVGILSLMPLIIMGCHMAIPSIPEIYCIIALAITTALSFVLMYSWKETSISIGSIAALLVLLMGADRVHDYVSYDRGTLSTLVDAACLLLCSIEYFHLLLKHSDQEKTIREQRNSIQRYEKQCKALEAQSADYASLKERHEKNLRLMAKDVRRYRELLATYEALKAKYEPEE